MPGSVAWWIMVGTMNFGPHTHLELSGPSHDLITMFLKNDQIGVSVFGGQNDKLPTTYGPIFFRLLESSLDLLSTCKVAKKFISANSRFLRSKLKI